MKSIRPVGYNGFMNTAIKWNPAVKLILSDVDETVADLYTEAKPEMIAQLRSLLEENKILFFITGQGLKSVQWRIVDQLPAYLRKHILVGHCSGAEICGYDESGVLLPEPFFSVYETQLDLHQKKIWREIVQTLISEFHLHCYPTMPVSEFMKQVGADPLAVMYEDRGPQITFECVNGYDMSPETVKTLAWDIPATRGVYDMRIPMLERADILLKQAHIPITPRLGGVFALDLAVEGVSKTTAVKTALQDYRVFSHVGLHQRDIAEPDSMEIWGDKFSVINGGSDRHMCEAVDPKVRAIDFRLEDTAEFMPGYHIVVWNGQKHLHNGLLEYLESRVTHP